jgi:rod shape-determining protein MreC
MQTKLFRAVLVLIPLVLCLMFQPRFILEPVRVVIATVAWPVQGILSTLAFELQDTVRFFTSIGDLKRENAHLVKENIRLTAENVRWQSVSQENDELRQELGLLPRDTYRLEAAEVIGRDAAGLGSWLTVDRGSSQGIAVGMPVIVYGGVLVGRVTEVFSNSARVMLLTHPESAVSGITVEGGAQGIVKGEYGLGLLFDMVLQDATLQPAHRVVTSGLGGELPKNLFIGTLQEARPSPDRLYKQIPIVSLISFDSLRYVFIIKNSL